MTSRTQRLNAPENSNHSDNRAQLNPHHHHHNHNHTHQRNGANSLPLESCRHSDNGRCNDDNHNGKNSVPRKHPRKPRPYFEFYINDKLEAAGSLKQAVHSVEGVLFHESPLKLDAPKFQVTETKPYRYRLLIPFTLWPESEFESNGEAAYYLDAHKMFELIQSTLKFMPKKRAVLMQACK